MVSSRITGGTKLFLNYLFKPKKKISKKFTLEMTVLVETHMVEENMIYIKQSIKYCSTKTS